MVFAATPLDFTPGATTAPQVSPYPSFSIHQGHVKSVPLQRRENHCAVEE
jgi:hypothetical protein